VYRETMQPIERWGARLGKSAVNATLRNLTPFKSQNIQVFTLQKLRFNPARFSNTPCLAFPTRSIQGGFQRGNTGTQLSIARTFPALYLRTVSCKPASPKVAWISLSSAVG